ncbi:MAG TPA: DNA polymerase III subunit gamma/tau [Defluviitoga sp.]|nr:DNA polymerase III subunit gamma/tau [Defluviitoga sp.]HOP25516.1 DNA polymerase III subunit gamma/tau [Defluviitoga sp.]HPZ28795.1 DNA polymerase III subunit gamma/tau [Defluviitoga sp.]HQD62862.1 DNA polymerase III subunit gamma/tau [Defluviitoga sp.]
MNSNLYRKYRPKDFGDIIGQPHVVKYFHNALKKGEISHAYIFSGPRGTGKTTTARILAKALNCKNPVNFNPCNECENCISINKNSFIDVIELDAASNRGIDEIRNIRDSTNYLPVYGNYKVYIIDEFHMLTREAFNALLKTLEEPPAHVIFVLATTNLEKVPDTIISRAQLINFKNLSSEDIFFGLKKIADLESIQYEEKALEIISRKAKGSMRDAISMFEQVEKFGDDKVFFEDVMDILGLFDESFIVRFINNILESDIDGFLEQSEELFKLGKDPEILLEESIEYLFEKIKEKEDPFFEIEMMNEFNNIIKDLKYSENRRLTFDVEIISFLTKNMRSRNTVASFEKIAGFDVDKELDSNKTLAKSEKFDNPVIVKIFNFFSNPRSKKSNLAIYFSLLSSKIEIKDNRIIFNFSENELLEYEILKKYRDELKVNISLLINESYEVSLLFTGKEKETFNIYEKTPIYQEKRLF